MDYVNQYSYLEFVDLTPNYRKKYKALKIEVVEQSSIFTYLKSFKITPGKKVLCYVRSAKQCLSLHRKTPRSGFLVSAWNEDIDKETGKKISDIMKEQRVDAFTSLLDYVLEFKRFPEDIDIIFINDAYSAGVNIQDELVDTVIVDSYEIGTVLQAKGRVRHNIEKLVVIYNFKEEKSLNKSIDDARSTILNCDDEIKLMYRYAEQKCADKLAEENNNKKLKIDYLVYEDNQKNYRLNPFARGIYEMRWDAFRKLKKYDYRTYWNPLKEETDNPIEFIKPECARGNANAANNREQVAGVVEFNKKYFAADLKELANSLTLLDNKYNKMGSTTLKKYLKEQYDSVEGRENNKRYIIFMPKSW